MMRMITRKTNTFIRYLMFLYELSMHYLVQLMFAIADEGDNYEENQYYCKYLMFLYILPIQCFAQLMSCSDR